MKVTITKIDNAYIVKKEDEKAKTTFKAYKFTEEMKLLADLGAVLLEGQRVKVELQ